MTETNDEDLTEALADLTEALADLASIYLRLHGTTLPLDDVPKLCEGPAVIGSGQKIYREFVNPSERAGQQFWIWNRISQSSESSRINTPSPGNYIRVYLRSRRVPSPRRPRLCMWSCSVRNMVEATDCRAHGRGQRSRLCCPCCQRVARPDWRMPSTPRGTGVGCFRAQACLTFSSRIQYSLLKSSSRPDSVTVFEDRRAGVSCFGVA
jgi:hypothetical protein